MNPDWQLILITPALGLALYYAGNRIFGLWTRRKKAGCGAASCRCDVSPH